MLPTNLGQGHLLVPPDVRLHASDCHKPAEREQWNGKDPLRPMVEISAASRERVADGLCTESSDKERNPESSLGPLSREALDQTLRDRLVYPLHVVLAYFVPDHPRGL